MDDARRGRTRQGASGASAGAGGHYADPLSPIASTPMKRPRTKPANTKSAKAKHPDVGSSPARPAVSTVEEEKFFSPRKLVKEYDDAEDEVGEKEQEQEQDSEKKTKRRKLNMDDGEEKSSANEGAEKHDAKANGHRIKHAELASVSANGTNAVMFSPVLKVPRGTRSPSGGNSPTKDSRARLDSAFASVSSSKSATPEKETNDEHATEEDVACEETSIVSEEAEASNNVAVEIEFNPFVFMKSLPKYDELVPNGRAAVLPAKTKHSPDFCLVLDLDETLVHCTVDDVENPHLQFPVNFNGMDYTVNVKKRPHMEYFLKQVSKRFEVVVFTASHRAYAEKLLNLIDPRRELIKYRLYREDCLDVYGNYLKDLNVLGRHLSKVVLVDNSPHAFGYQVNNGIPIETWYDDEADDELLNLLPFLDSLLDVDDVRPIVEKQFQIQKLIDSLPDEFI